MAPMTPPDLNAPWSPTHLLQLRTSKMKQMHNLSIQTGIYKLPREDRIWCTKTGFVGDEHDLTFHGGVDKAVHQYYSGHYPVWRSEFPSGSNFELGAFGENLITANMNERNVCIGDIISLGPTCVLQVSLPRQPCFKLNHRFSLKGFTGNTTKLSRTGWYYRVLEEGWVGAGDEMRLVERKWPKWTIERVQEYLHRDTSNLPMLEELADIPEFGAECKRAFASLITKAKSSLSSPVKKVPETFMPFVLHSKTKLTPRITSFTFLKSNCSPDIPGEELDPGCFAKLQLPNGLTRSYSIVSGDSNKLTFGIAREEESRGGSRYLHDQIQVGDTIEVGKITEGVPIPEGASNHIFIAGGIGITAFLHHVDIYDQINYDYTLHYAVRSSEEVAFKGLLEGKKGRIVVYNGEKGERMDIKSILGEKTWSSYLYVCGPTRMVDAFQSAADGLGMGADEYHIEAFQALTTGDPFEVELKSSGKVLEVGEDQTLLEVLKDAGLEIESSCEVGNCGTCRIEVCKGRVEHRGIALPVDDMAQAGGKGGMLSCVSRGSSRIVVEL